MDVTRAGPLLGRGIVVTRPREQAHAIAELIRQRGGRPIEFPAIEISPPADPAQLQGVIERLDTFDLAIFISPVAVDHAMAAIEGQRSFPRALRVAAVGAGSARALARHGAKEVIVPSGRFDSESLLDCEELAQVAGKRVVVFRGDGGRDLIAETLRARGASVEYAQCYRRSCPAGDVAPLVEAWSRNELDAFIVTSSEALRNLAGMLGAPHVRMLADTPLFVPHRRIAETARELDLRAIVETPSGDQAMVQALVDHFSGAAG